LFKSLLKNAVKGLLTILPLVLTLYVFWLVVSSLASIFAAPLHFTLKRIVEDVAALPAWVSPALNISGFIIGIIALILVGVLVNNVLAQRMLKWFDGKLTNIPLAKTLYGSIKDLLGLFSGESRAFRRVVLVNMPGVGQKVLGLVTREDCSDMKGVPEGTITVYIPMSYQIGGFTIYVPKDSVEPLDVSVEDAMRFTITAGVSSAKPEAKQE
jgi:uncharacterized membrane protein